MRPIKFLYLLLVVGICTAYFPAPRWIDVKEIGAVGNGAVDDSWAFQKAFDSCNKVRGRINVPPGTYKITQTIVGATRAANGNYAQSYIRIYGEDTKHSPGVSIIRSTVKDGPTFAFHLNKGSVISGLFFDGPWKTPVMSIDSFFRAPLDTYGDTTCRDSKFSPQCAIAIDPFRPTLPPDSGYPRLRQFYGGANGVSGSTGITIEHCTFKNFTIGLIISPNGYTLNAELMRFKEIRVNDCKYAFVGCQAQEKDNLIEGWELWGRIKCCFAWAKYGQGQPGNYRISGLNGAGVIGQFIHRPSQNFFPLFVDGAFFESIYYIGYWNTGMNDAMSNSSFNFYYYKYAKSIPNNHMNGNGVLFNNVHMRYYVEPPVSLFFKGNMKFSNSEANVRAPHIKGAKWNYLAPDTTLPYTFKKISVGKPNLYVDSGFVKAQFYQTWDSVKVGDRMAFSQANNDIEGWGEVVRIDPHGYYTISYISPGIVPTLQYQVGKLIVK